MKRAIGIISALLGLSLVVSVCLPWVYLPVLGQEVPTPAWNWAGLACAVAGLFNFLRAVVGQFARWLVRISLIPAAYLWWGSLQAFKVWGAHTFGPAQIKMATVNSALARLGVEPVTLYDALAWKRLEPAFGWYACGASLILAALLTLLDGPRFRNCPACRCRTKSTDAFCPDCGTSVSQEPVCTNCGTPAATTDKFCRSCGSAQEKKLD